MANSPTTRGFILAAWLLILTGALVLVQLLFSLLGPSRLDVWLVFSTNLALAAAFVVLFLQREADLFTRIAFIVAAFGWAILALAVIASVGAILTLDVFLALAGTAVAGILVIARTLFPRGASIAFLISAILAALLLLTEVVAYLPGTVGLVIEVFFGIALIATGVLTVRKP
jgi:hypothetical protein